MDSPLTVLRAAYPALDQGLCFLDWAATGLLPETTRAAVGRYLEEVAACPSGESTWMHGVHAVTRQEVRQGVARLIGTEARHIALVENTTAGLNGAASAIRLRRGDNVVLSELDYPAVAMPWRHRQRRDEIDLRFVPPRGALLEAADVVERIDERTRVVALSTLCWTSGALVDLESIARETRMRGILLVVDAVQTFGVIPLDVGRIPVSFLSVGGHKWLCSPLGAGFLYVHPQVAARHQPPWVGLLSGEPPRGSWAAWFADPASRPDDEIAIPATARAFESGGTPSYPGALGLRESLALVESAGVERISDHVRALGGRLMDGLDALDLQVVTPREPDRRAGVVVFHLPAGPEAERELVVRLRERGIVVGVRYAAGVGGIRVSFHGMNTTSEVDRLLDALA